MRRDPRASDGTIEVVVQRWLDAVTRGPVETLQDPHLDPAIKQRITQAILVGSPETKGAIPGIKTIDIPHIADTRHMQMMGRIAQRVAELKNAPATTPSDVTIRSRANQTDIQFLAERGGHSTIAMHRDMPGETGHLSPEFAARLASAAQAYEAQTGKKTDDRTCDRPARAAAGDPDRRSAASHPPEPKRPGLHTLSERDSRLRQRPHARYRAAVAQVAPE